MRLKFRFACARYRYSRQLRSSTLNAARYRHDDESFEFYTVSIENHGGAYRGPYARLVEEIGHDWIEIVMAITSGNQWAALRPHR